MIYANEGKMLITSSADETVRFWDLARKREIKTINAVSRCNKLDQTAI